MSSPRWQQLYSRRSILGGICLGTAVSGSGCLARSLNQGVRERDRNVVVKNTGDTVRSVTISIKSPNEERLFRWRHRLEPGVIIVAGMFHGFPHTITIRVGSDSRTAEYVPPTGDCTTATITIEILATGVPQIHSRCGDVSHQSRQQNPK